MPRPICLLLLAVLLNGCSSSGSPITPTADTPPPVMTIPAFSISVENVGSGLLYHPSYQVAETSGRAHAIINTVTFAFASGSFVTNANPSTPARLTAGTTLFSGVLNISDTAGVTAGTTSVMLTIGYADDLGRANTISKTATVTR